MGNIGLKGKEWIKTTFKHNYEHRPRYIVDPRYGSGNVYTSLYD